MTGVRFPAATGIFITSPHIPNRLWCPPSFLSNGCRGLFSRV